MQRVVEFKQLEKQTVSTGLSENKKKKKKKEKNLSRTKAIRPWN